MGRGSRNSRKANSEVSIAALDIQIAGAKKHKTISHTVSSTPAAGHSLAGISIAGTKAGVQKKKPPVFPIKKSKEGISIVSTKHTKQKQGKAPVLAAPFSKSIAAEGITIAGKSRVQNDEKQKQSPKDKYNNSSATTKQPHNNSRIDIARSTSTKSKKQQHQQARKKQYQQPQHHTGNIAATAATPSAAFPEGIAISGAATQVKPSKHKKTEAHADNQPLVSKRRKSMSRDSSPMPTAKRRSIFGVHFERALRFNNTFCENSSDSMESFPAHSEDYSALAADIKPITQSTTASFSSKDVKKPVLQQMHNIKRSQQHQQLRGRRLSDPVNMHSTQQNISKKRSINQRIKIPVDKPQVRYVVPMNVLGVQEQLPMHSSQSIPNELYLSGILPGTDNGNQSAAAPRVKKRNKKRATRDCGVTECVIEPLVSLPETAMATTAADDYSNSNTHTFKKSPRQANTSAADFNSAVAIQNPSLDTQILGCSQEQHISIGVQDEAFCDIEIDPIVDFGD
ncbi:hypothetical protein COEREDRAFT_7950 [Coemansia reversa NRRL 1564]|uniref:Uncharacterized protein n=1 Tax=Coemansia reversa (strain ATCC 12441 / NRRL 1564) TaxID=763665 RepID=A0A2G5BCS1_COERN|nr:hypothetical protein COEREDRAFT_7950 [Coemansia reversa NRRL 1564]|eukprot:PIA16801.1 hypothetical protein COEREDRAFT_7950 [Coemansia reversa NRRL 1564]